MRDGFADHLLDWYDGNARVLPWRIGPAEGRAGIRPDPYRVWLSEIMLQQTTVAAVRAYFLRFTDLWPTVDDLARAEDARVMAEWAGLGYYARARNLLRGARTVAADHAGVFPDTRTGLLALPGIGPYTAAAILAIAFDRAETVVDGNVERVVARIFDVQTPLPAAKPELTALAGDLTPSARPGDYAQAMMDLGATICTPRTPSCGACPVAAHCAARQAGHAADLPRKVRRAPKSVRHGIVHVGWRQDGAWLVETRPGAGLLGGMLAFPCSDWTEGAAPPATPPTDGDWTSAGSEIRHTFTHFHLRLAVWVAHLPQSATPVRGRFLPAAAFDPAALPTLFRKAHTVALGALRD